VQNQIKQKKNNETFDVQMDFFPRGLDWLLTGVDFLAKILKTNKNVIMTWLNVILL
jgi:hypothetical protein